MLDVACVLASMACVDFARAIEVTYPVNKPVDELRELKDKQGVGWVVYDHWLKSAEGLLERHDERGTTTPRHCLDVSVMKVCSAKSKTELSGALDDLSELISKWRSEL